MKNMLSSLKQTPKITLFNVIGLSTAFAAFLMLSIYIWNELTYDSDLSNRDQIVLMEGSTVNSGSWMPFAPKPIADILEDKIPQIESHCTFHFAQARFSRENETEEVFSTVRNGNFSSNNLWIVDSTFIDLFHPVIVQGNTTPLHNEESILLSEQTAKQIFGEENPIGQVLVVDFKKPIVVEAVFKDFPINSTFHSIKALVPFKKQSNQDWSEWSFIHFCKVTPGTSLVDLATQVKALPEVEEHILGDSMVTDIRFSSANEFHFSTRIGNGNKRFVYILLAISIALVTMAMLNYLNFTIASVPKQIKSVSLRKVIGESTLQTYAKGFAESSLLVSIAFLLGISLLLFANRIYPTLLGYSVELPNYWFLFVLSWVVFIVLGGVCRLFSSRMILSVELSSALKGLVPFSMKSRKTKNILPIIQYTCSIVLLIGVLVLKKQINYVLNYDLGFNKENLLVVNTGAIEANEEQAFVNELYSKSTIKAHAFSGTSPGNVGMGWGRVVDGKNVNFKAWPIDEKYIDLMGFEVIEGRTFSENIKADENNLICNEAFVQKFGWEGQVIGKTISTLNGNGKIVGVVKDIKYASLYEQVEPMCFWLTSKRHNELTLSISDVDVSNTIQHIESVFKQFEERYSFSYYFLDDKLNSAYKRTEKQIQLVVVFCLISVLISLIGALGMAIFSCEFRRKEIGVRKVNGANEFEILNLLNRSFFTQVLIAFAIALPIAYWVMSNWMNEFAFKTELSWWIFATGGLLILVLVLSTVSFQSWRTARQNPVKALRSE